jgi:hypothetical protein
MIQPKPTNLVNPSYGPSKKKKAKKAASRTGGHKHRSGNPAPIVLTLGAINPHKERRMASKKKSKKKASRAKSGGGTHAKKSNPSRKTQVVSMSTMKSMLGMKKKGKKKGRSGGVRNPQVFGTSRPVQIVGMFAGVAGGVTAVKLIPPMLPATWQTSNGMRFLTSVGVAIGTGVIAHFTLAAPYRDAVIVGAGSQVFSIALNPIVQKVAPTVTLEGIRRRGVGDFVAARFPEPNNPIYRPQIATGAVMAPGATSSGGNLGRYRSRYIH